MSRGTRRRSGWSRRVCATGLASLLVIPPSCGDESGEAPVAVEDDELRGGAAPDPEDIGDEVDTLRGQPVVLAPTSAVGTLPASFDVDDGGEAHYRIPIEVTPGVHGMEPVLAIVYGSNADDGMFGDRVHLSGMSSISRCPRTTALDGAYAPIGFDENDALCMNGERLLLASGEHGHADAEYRTRHDPFAKIVLDDDMSRHNGTITVWARDGRVLTFGTSEASLWYRPNAEIRVPYRWALQRQCDRYDNCIDYEYEHGADLGTGPSDLRPVAIRYGGTGDAASQRSVEFDWIDRDDATENFFFGARQLRDVLIDRVTVYGRDGVRVRYYELEYGADAVSGRTQLESAALCDASDVCLPATTFEWNAPADTNISLQEWGDLDYFEGLDLAETQLELLEAKHTLVGDFDADGDEEVLFEQHDDPWILWSGGTGEPAVHAALPFLDAVLPPDNQRVVDELLNVSVDTLTFPEAQDLFHRFQPDFTASIVRFVGEVDDDIFIPIRDGLPGENDSIDADGHSYATHFAIAISQGVGPQANFVFQPFDDGSTDPIYQMVPFDQNGDGFSDVWMCRGASYADGNWVLARHNGGGSTALGFEFHETGVSCSAHDELLVTSPDGGPPSLLFIRAYDDAGELLPDAERTSYQQLRFDPLSETGVVTPTNLPRDTYQRVHDRYCWGGLPISLYGGSLLGAGIGYDKQLDVNGDGLPDILRFELVDGDDASTDFDAIAAGLPNGEWDDVEQCGDDADLAHDAGLVVYYNTGRGYERGDFVLDLPGNAHANFWLNVVGAVQYDIDDDNRFDLLLPAVGDGTDWTALSVRPDGSWWTDTAGIPDGWPAYDDDENWRDEIVRGASTRVLAFTEVPATRAALAFVGLVEEEFRTQWPAAVNIRGVTVADSVGRVQTIIDGLGAEIDITTGSTFTPDHGAQWPAAPLGQALWVTKEVQRTSPGGGPRWSVYDYQRAAFDRRTGSSLGFETTRVETDFDVTFTRFDRTYDATMEEFTHRGRPVERRTLAVVRSNEQWIDHFDRATWTWTTKTLEVGDHFASFTYPQSHTTAAYALPPGVCALEEPCVDFNSARAYREATTTEARDDFAVLVSSVETVANGTQTTLSQTEVEHDLDAWLIGMVGLTSVERCRDGACVTRTSRNAYDDVTGALTHLWVQPGDPILELHTAYGLDAHGNVAATLQDSPSDLRLTSTTWDAEGAFPESHTNQVGHVSYTVFDPASGALLAQVDAGGVTSKTSYDGVYRPVLSSLHGTPLGPHDGAPTATEYLAGDTEAPLLVRSTTPNGQRVTEFIGPTGHLNERRWLGMAPIVGPVPPSAPIPVGGEVYQRFDYDPRGTLLAKSLPQWLTQPEPTGWYTRVVDNLGRETERRAPDNFRTEWIDYVHSGVRDTTTVYSRSSQGSSTLVEQTQVDPQGLPSAHTDANGYSTCFYHTAFDQLQLVERNCGPQAGPKPTSSTVYDDLGHVISQSDTSLGTRISVWNAFGELEQHTDGESRVTDYAYDDLGRMTSRTDDDGITLLVYDTERPGTLAQTLSTDLVTTLYSYDDFGRSDGETRIVPSTSGADTYETTYDRGPGGRVEVVHYPVPDGEPAMAVRMRYDDAGYLRAAFDTVTNKPYWALRTANQHGQTETEEYGEAISTVRAYDPLRLWPKQINTHAGAFQNLSYEWFPEGELRSRTDVKNGQVETFGYDKLWRLQKATVTGATPVVTNYDVLGNITSKTGVGVYGYDAQGELTSFGGVPVVTDDGGNVTSYSGKTLTYTPFGKVRSVTSGGSLLQLAYDGQGDRVRRRDNVGADTITLGTLYERKLSAGGATQAIKYRVQAGGRTVAEIVRTKPAAVWVDAVRYMHDDFLGSTQLVSSKNALGVPVAVDPIAYDAWGRARPASNWKVWATAAQTNAVSIGFTGHRAELDHGLIDMGGRMYDPLLSRFTSADPLVSDPYAGQPYNRYSYVGNRPLKFVDPSGWAEEPGTPEGEEFSSDDEEDDDGSWYAMASNFGRGAMRLGADTLNGIDEYIEYIGEWDAELSAESIQGLAHATWNSPICAPARLGGREIADKLEQAKDVAIYVLTHPHEIAAEQVDRAIANATTVLCAYGTIKSALERGDYLGAAEAWVDAAKAAWSLAGLVVGGAGVAAKVARTAKAIRASRTVAAAAAPAANLGQSKPHGSPAHDARLRKIAASMRGKGWEDVRVNQWQVNASGQLVGANRPDVSGIHPRTGRRVNVEVDTRASSSAEHQRVVTGNDPDAVNTFIIIDALGRALSSTTIRP